MNQQKIIVLYDYNWHGHHQSYLLVLSKALLNRNYKVWLFCQNPEEITHKLRDSVSQDKMRNIIGHPIKPLKNRDHIHKKFFRGALEFQMAAKHIKDLQKQAEASPDLVFFLKIDDYTVGFLSKSMGEKIFPYPWAGLYIHVQPPSRNRLKFAGTNLKSWAVSSFFASYSIFNSKKCKFLATLQEDTVEELRTLVRSPVVHFPDPTHEPSSAKTALCEEILQKAGGRKIIGLLGIQARRKGTFKLLEIAHRCQNKDWFFVLAGESSPPIVTEKDLSEMKQIIETQNLSNCFFYPKRPSDEGDFNALFKICDVVFAVYDDFPYSSSIITKSALFQKPILVSSGTLMALRINKYQLGLSCPPDNLDTCVAALEKLLLSEIPNPGYKEYFDKNSAVYLEEHLDSLLTNVLTKSEPQ